MTPLYLPRWQEVLIAIFKLSETQRYPQKLYRVCPTSSSHAKTIIKTLHYYNLIHINKKGSRRFLKLTSQGETLSQHLIQVRWILSSLFRDPAEPDSSVSLGVAK